MGCQEQKIFQFHFLAARLIFFFEEKGWGLGGFTQTCEIYFASLVIHVDTSYGGSDPRAMKERQDVDNKG